MGSINWFIDITLMGSITALIILIIKFIFKNKMTPKWHYYILLVLLLSQTIKVKSGGE